MEASRGVSLGNEIECSFIRADERLRPLNDRLFVEPLPLDLNTTLEVVYRGRPVRGIVRAVGPGRYPWKYLDSQGRPTQKRGDRKTAILSRHFRPTDVKVGDVVDFGGLEREGYLFPLIRWGDIDVVLCREEDVCVVVEQPA